MSEDGLAFGALLKDYRLAAGLTQEALAERAGLSTRAISDLERGVNRVPRQDTLDLLARALALPPRKLVLLVAAARPQVRSADALASLAQPPHNLPIPPTRLIGRETDVTRATTLLSRDEVRLLTLTGPAGVGKTRLGLQVAEDLLERCEDGVWLVALAPVHDVSLVAPTIAQALGLRASVGQPPQELVKETIGRQQMLLMLDNFEQVAGAAPLVADLVSACPRLKLLVTSRAALHVRGEHELVVAPLEQEAAVTLFLQRAQAVQSDLAFTVENIQAAGTICRRLDRLPLALELAAAHVKVLPLPALLERMTSRFAWLRGGALDLPERQRTMHDAIAWSYDLLGEAEQRLFRRLGVFVGGCTLEAAEAICVDGGGGGEEAEAGADGVLEGMEALVDSSLLHTETPAHGMPRFTMLETIRVYAQERLQTSGEAETLARRHLTYFIHQAEDALHFGPERDEQLARLARERANVHAALAWARERQETGLGLRLVNSCGDAWFFHGMLGDLLPWFDDLLALDATAGARAASAAVRVQALYMLGESIREQGEYTRAEQLARDALDLAERASDQSGMGNALRVLGELAQGRGDRAEAARLLERGLACCREVNDMACVVLARMSLAHLARTGGDYDCATRIFEEHVALARPNASRWGLALNLSGLGMVARDQGDHRRALALFWEALGIHQTFGNLTFLAWDFEGLAPVVCALGDPERATELCAAATQFRVKAHTPRPPAEQVGYDHTLDAARAALGHEAFEQAWATGSALTGDAAVALALSSIDSLRCPSS
jgi:predicted ATPase/DNA-binding XRE family transcriptional regulator